MDGVIERLLGDGSIDEARLAEGKEIAEGAGLPLIRVLFHLKLVDPKAVAGALSAVLNRPICELEKIVLPPSPIADFSAGLCRELRVFPLALEAGEVEGQTQLVLAMSDPTDKNAGERVAAFVAKDVRPVLVVDDALTDAIAARYDPPAAGGSAEREHAGEQPKQPQPVVERTVLMLVEAVTSDDPDAWQSPGTDGEVFALAPRAEKTELMRAPPDCTVMQRSPFLDPSSQATDSSSVYARAHVFFVSADKKVRLRVAADLAPLVRTALVFDDLKRAVESAEREKPDEVVVHAPKNDAGTGLLLDRLAKASGQGIVVISDVADFLTLPCVRRIVAPPPLGPAAIAPLILEGLFERA